MPPKPPLPTLTFPTPTSFSTWLASHSTTSPGIWLTLARKNQTHPTSLTIDQALEEALCHGWINGQARTDPVSHNLEQRFTPRGRYSTWSLRNVRIVERLEGEGRLRDGGRGEVERAKGDGRWARAYSGGGAVEEAPGDLMAVVSREGVEGVFAGLGRGERYKEYMALVGLRTEKGRERRIRGFVEGLKEVRDGRVEKQEREDGVVSTRSGRKVRKPAS